MLKARITGLGSYLPKRVMTNYDFEKIVDTSHEWIIQRTGIEERRIAEPDEHPSDMGKRAAGQALDRAGVAPAEVELIIVATMTPDYPSPSTAAILQQKIGAVHAGVVDINAACSGYLYGISTAKAFVESGMYRTVLFVATEKMSSIVDYTDRTTCILFGDGAAAAVVQREGPGLTIEGVCLGGDGSEACLMQIPAGGAVHPASQATVAAKEHYFRMDGKAVYKHAVRRMAETIDESLSKACFNRKDLRWIVPHQANVRIMDSLAKFLGVPESIIYQTIQKYGNTSASSIGIALDELIQEEGVTAHDVILLVSFGVGLTWGSCLLRKI